MICDVDIKKVAEAMKQHRVKAGLSCQKLAKLAGISAHCIRAYEYARSYPGLYNLICIANALNIGIEEYIGINSPNAPLTVKELQKTNNEPIYVKDLLIPGRSAWRILHWDRGKRPVLIGVSKAGYPLEEYGKSWIAFKRKPESMDGKAGEAQ